MIKNKNGKLLAVAFVSVCMFVAMLGGFVGLFDAVDTSTPVIADAATTVESYYQSLADDLNKTGTAFRSELATLITSTQTHNTSYDELKTVYKTSDADPNKSGNIIWFYTGTSISYNGTLGSGSGATNREHVWPKNNGNAFPAKSEAGSDAHHLRPAEATLNSTRSDNSFGEVPQTNANIVDEAGSTSYPSLCYQANQTFYPGVGYRGATARILMYVQTRWGDAYNLKFVLGNGENKTIGDIETLMKWHIQEPPTEAEKTRNEVVFGIQGNRNPFIDHPEYAEMIYCHDGQSYNDELQAVVKQYGSYLDNQDDDTLEVESVNLSTTNATLIVGETMSINASVTPSNAVSTVTWTSSNPNVASVSNGKITALANGTTTITATSTKTPSVKATATITVKSVSAIAVSGTPTKTSYTAGETFNPIGLTVTAIYSDTSTAIIPNAQITWLDGTTRQKALSEGTTTIIAKYGNLEKTISGITVKAPSNTIFTFGENGNATHDDGSSITSKTYTQGAYTLTISNGTKLYDSAFDAMGNSALKLGTSSATGSFTFTVPSNVNSVVIYVAQYKANATTVTVNGTSHTITTSSNNGEYTPITVDTSSTKTVNFATTSSGKRCMIDKIEYVVEGDTSCSHVAGNWIVDQESTCNVAGSRHNECTKCGEVMDIEELPLADHKWGNWTTTTEPECDQFGEETRECSVCHETEANQLPKTQHTWGNWVDNGNGTETRECSGCNETDTRECANLSDVEDFENAVDAVVNANGLEAKWNAIGTALSKYKGLSDSEKDTASEAYATLTTQIRDYNAQIGSINTQSQKATSDALNLLASTIAVLAVGAYLLLKA